MSWTASVTGLQTGSEAFKYGYFPDAATPFGSDATFMQRRRAMILGTASGDVDSRTGRLVRESGLGRLAYVLDQLGAHKGRFSPDEQTAPVGDPAGPPTVAQFLADTLKVGQAESTIVLAVLAAIDLGWKPLLRHDRGDPLDLVNRFLLAMRPWKVGEGDGYLGNYDFLLANFVTVAAQYDHLLSRQASEHLLSSLLTQFGPVDQDQLRVAHGPFGVVSYGETENHILQIEVARYLTNQIVGFDNRKAGVTSFLLGMLQRFLQNDFLEYNARPYQDHSVRAITALYDLGRDAEVRTGAQLVLEYLAAKFAVSSNGLRRHVPFRRRREHTWDPGLLDDEESKRFLAVTGMGRLFRTPAPGSGLIRIEGFSALPAVLTAFRPSIIARDLIMTNRHKQYYQRFKHSGVEIFYSTPAFLVTAGGIRVGSAVGSDWAHLEDISVPLATTLMPSTGGVDVRDIIRIAGNDTDELKINTGVARGFVCGLNPIIPVRYELAGDPDDIDPEVAIVNATRLPNPEGLYFAVCVRTQWAQAAGEAVWLVAVPAIEMSFDRFRRDVLDGQGSTASMDTTGVNHVRIASVGSFTFTPAGDRANPRRLPIRGSQDEWDDCSNWPLAEGDVMNAEGHSGVVHIDHPVMPFLSARARRSLRISAVLSVRRIAARRGIPLHAGLRQLLQDLTRQGIHAGGSMRGALDVLSRRLTLDMRDVNGPVRIAPHFTAREVACMLGRGLVGDVHVRQESARSRVDLSRGLRNALSDLRGRGIDSGGSVTRAFEALSGRSSPTGDVSIRACFTYHRLSGAPDLMMSTLLRGE